ncbi:MAG: rhodanese-like domain-containing protein [Armatimonadetes bacterium]|nr:rhodanese-like domain-containing protein [Armatimonadota bacterium]
MRKHKGASPSWLAAWLTAATVLVLSGCSGGSLPSGGPGGGGQATLGEVGALDLWQEVFSDSPPSVVDVRPADQYDAFHIPGSVSKPNGVGLAGVLSAQGTSSLVIVGRTDEDARAVAEQLVRKGKSARVLVGGIENWTLGLDISAATLKAWLDGGRNVVLIDVRGAGEYASGHINGSINRPLDEISEWAPNLDAQQEYVMICGIGARSKRARDTLARQYGLTRVHNLLGGVSAWPYGLVGCGCGG